MHVTVSVIVPAFNCAGTIRTAIDSVLTQDFRDLEIIVVDDGSTDATPSVLTEYDDRITVIRQSNQGAAVARNNGIKAARGRFIAFLDSDDEWYPWKLSRQLTLFENRPHVGLVSSAAKYADESGFTQQIGRASISGNLTQMLLYRDVIVTSSVLLKRSCLLSLKHLFRPEFQPAEDWELWLRLSGCCDFIVSPEVLVTYHTGAGGLSRKYTAGALMSIYKSIYASLRDDPTLCTPVEKQWQRLQANAHLLAACRWHEVGESWAARREVFRAIAMSKFRLNWPTALAILLLSPRMKNRLRLAVFESQRRRQGSSAATVVDDHVL